MIIKQKHTGKWLPWLTETFENGLESGKVTLVVESARGWYSKSVH
jgi:hypothetical protein